MSEKENILLLTLSDHKSYSHALQKIWEIHKEKNSTGNMPKCCQCLPTDGKVIGNSFSCLYLSVLFSFSHVRNEQSHTVKKNI